VNFFLQIIIFTGEPIHSASKKVIVPHTPVISESIYYISLSAMFNPLHSSMDQKYLYLHNQSSHYNKNAAIFVTEGGHHNVHTTKSTLFTVSKDEWDTKEDTGKSLKNALDVLQYAKRCSR